MVVLLWFAFALVGGLIGRSKGRVLAGVLWSLLLGPIGWIIVALSKGNLQQCPSCRSWVDPQAIACPKCARDISPVGVPAQGSRPVHSSPGRAPNKRNVRFGVYTALAVLAALALIGALNHPDNQSTVTHSAAQKTAPFPPNVLSAILTVYRRGTDFGQACAEHENLSQIHAKLLVFRSSAVSALAVTGKANFPPGYRRSASTFRRGLVEIRDGADRTLDYWSKGDLNAIPEGERRVQHGLAVINAEVNRLNNSD